MVKIWDWFKKELREMVPIWAFFFLCFALLSITLSVTLGRYQLERYQPPEFLICSLIVAKAVMLIGAFTARRWFLDRPLIYMTVWNTCLYSLATLALYYVDQVIKLVWRQHLAFGPATDQVVHRMAEPGFLLMAVWLIALMFAFCTIRELAGRWERSVSWMCSCGDDPHRSKPFARSRDLQYRHQPTSAKNATASKPPPAQALVR
jgi:hypothetical protein